MPTQVDPSKNTTALLIGTGEFSFAEDCSTVAQANAKGFLDFGNIAAFTPKTDTQKLEHKGAYRGVLRLDKTAVTESKVQYQLKCDEWNVKNLQIIFGGGSVSAGGQAANASAAGNGFDFATPGNFLIGKWYDINVSGAHVHDLSGVSIGITGGAALTEGTDYVLDLLLGRAKFLTAQTAVLTSVVSSNAITTASEEYQQTFIPLVNVRRQGMGRLVCFDQYSAEKVVFQHVDFSCEVTLDSTDELAGSAFANITMTVNTTSLPGVIKTRAANVNSGVALV